MKWDKIDDGDYDLVLDGNIIGASVYRPVYTGGWIREVWSHESNDGERYSKTLKEGQRLSENALKDQVVIWAKQLGVTAEDLA